MVIRAGRAPSGGKVSGHDYVDLGLPSGTLWATCNVGAKYPKDYGDYFAWGETLPQNGDNMKTTLGGTNSRSDVKTVLEASDDAATANWGANWRMPTIDEVDELFSVCTSVWTSHNGVNGRLLTGPNGKSIFLPAAGGCHGTTSIDSGVKGYYWSRSFEFGNPRSVGGLGLIWDSNLQIGVQFRYYGLPVRPVVKR